MAKTKEELDALSRRFFDLAEELGTLTNDELDYVAGGVPGIVTCGKGCDKAGPNLLTLTELDGVVGGYPFGGPSLSPAGKSGAISLLKILTGSKFDAI